jgi:heat shock protein HtpX
MTGATSAPSRDPSSGLVRLVVVSAAVPAVILGAVGLLGGIVVAVVVFVVVAVLAGLGAALLWRGAGTRLRARVGGRPADPRTDARLLNLIDGLCTAAGLRPPDVRVIDSPGLNALVVGTDPAASTLAVTTGLLAELSRIELEGVLADELLAIRRRWMLPATLAASIPPPLSRLAGGTTELDEREGDLAAVGLTRYPPGLVGALQKMAAKGTAVDTPASLAPLWFADPQSGHTSTGRVSLDQRIEALEDL